MSKSVGNQVWNEVRDKVWNCRDKVWHQVIRQTGREVSDKIWAEIRDQVDNRVRLSLKGYIRNKVLSHD